MPFYSMFKANMCAAVLFVQSYNQLTFFPNSRHFQRRKCFQNQVDFLHLEEFRQSCNADFSLFCGGLQTAPEIVVLGANSKSKGC